jgi:hypothetical protein
VERLRRRRIMPIIKYECRICGNLFLKEERAIICEKSHFNGLSDLDKGKMLAEHSGKFVCNFCKNAYYAYGCELACKFEGKCHTGTYKSFILLDKYKNN